MSVGRDRVIDAMRSGEWLRSQWIARVACDIGSGPWRPDKGARTQRTLRQLEADGLVEHLDATEHRRGEVGNLAIVLDLPRHEWRLIETPTPLERPQFRTNSAVTPSHNTPQTQAQSESRRPDSNRGPLHYESSDHDTPGLSGAAQGQNAARVEPRQTPPEQGQRPQNAPSNGRLQPGARPAPLATTRTWHVELDLQLPPRDAPDDEEDGLAHVCAVHGGDDFACAGASGCFSYCGFDLPAEFADIDGDDSVLCIVCQDLAT